MRDLHPGDAVVYIPYPGARAEDGVVVSLNTAGDAFVRYRGSETPKMTRRSDLHHALSGGAS
jgi:hypothetical protein